VKGREEGGRSYIREERKGTRGRGRGDHRLSLDGACPPPMAGDAAYGEAYGLAPLHKGEDRRHGIGEGTRGEWQEERGKKNNQHAPRSAGIAGWEGSVWRGGCNRE